MKNISFEILPNFAIVVALVFLTWLTILYPPGFDTLGLSLVFLILIVVTSVFSAPLEGGMASLTPMVTVSGFLLIGLVPAGWIVFMGAGIYSLIRNQYSKHLGVQREKSRGDFINLAAANIAAKTFSILVGGALYTIAGGIIPLVEIDKYVILPLVLLGLGYFAINDLLFGSYIAAWEARSFHQSRRLYYRSIIFEGAPLIFSPIIALLYTNIGATAFILACFAIVAISVITRNLAFTSHRLERQLKEMQSLQEVGQIISSSLDLNSLLMTIYKQVSNIMPAELFSVALLDKYDNELFHPLTMVNGEAVSWSSKIDERDLITQVMQTQLPTLSQENTGQLRALMKPTDVGRSVTSWLCVPVIAGEEVLGAIIVQSFSVYDLYDQKHQEILMTIASQAAVAIQNAYLYERTDEALRNRVQEMDSILRTIDEGVLLMDLNYKVLTVNKALSSKIGAHRSEIVGERLTHSDGMFNNRLLDLVGYSREALFMDCKAIKSGEYELKTQVYAVDKPKEKRIERTLTPVRDFEGTITAWLLIIRDVTEEFEITRLREDMMQTLVHDLRSPLAVVKGSLEVLRYSEEDAKKENIDDLLRLALIGTERMLRLINNLLDVSRLEDGQMVVTPEWVSIEPIVNTAIGQVLPEAKRVNIHIESIIEDDLPPLYVDQAHMERILNNLLDNAIKFTPNDGRIKLLAKLDPDYSPASIIMGVSDTGPGIPLEIQGQLFNKYKQFRTGQGRRTGSGVGLYYCKLAVEAHRGQIWVESQVGQGSTFYFRLPLAP